MLFGKHFENEFSKKINAKKKSQSFFTALKRIGAPLGNQCTSLANYFLQYFQESSLLRQPRCMGQLSTTRVFFNVGVRITPFVSVCQSKLESWKILECTPNIEKHFSDGTHSRCGLSWMNHYTFQKKNGEKIATNPSSMSLEEDYKSSLLKIGGWKDTCRKRKGKDEPKQFLSSIFIVRMK